MQQRLPILNTLNSPRASLLTANIQELEHDMRVGIRSPY